MGFRDSISNPGELQRSHFGPCLTLASTPQKIAAENNLSETAYYVHKGGTSYNLRCEFMTNIVRTLLERGRGDIFEGERTASLQQTTSIVPAFLWRSA